jgi:hypothetical protein
MMVPLVIGALTVLALYLGRRLAVSKAEILALRNKNASLKRQLGHRSR